MSASRISVSSFTSALGSAGAGGADAPLAGRSSGLDQPKWVSTPAIVVGGKYMAQPAEPARLLQVVNELVAKVASGK